MRHNLSEIKNKTINHLMDSGKKNTGEKLILKSFKELQRSSDKQSKDLMKLAIIFSTPTFKLHIMSQKKRKKKKNQKNREIPAFIAQTTARISLAIKFILTTVKKRKSENFYSKLKEEIILNAQYRGEAVKMKNELQKRVLVSKRFFRYFRWR